MRTKTKKIKQVLDNGETVYWWLEKSTWGGLQLMVEGKSNSFSVGSNHALTLKSDGTIKRSSRMNDFGLRLTTKQGKMKIAKD